MPVGCELLDTISYVDRASLNISEPNLCSYLLSTHRPQYIADLVSWVSPLLPSLALGSMNLAHTPFSHQGAIGARTTESQLHR